MSLSQMLYDRIRDTVQWAPLPVRPEPSDAPYATHEGWVRLGEDALHVFRLNTGEQVIEAESLAALMNGPFGFWSLFLAEHPEWEQDVMFAPDGLDNIKAGALSARPEATKAFVQWAVDHGLARHPERAPGLVEQLNYHAVLERQAMARRKPKLRLMRPPRNRQ